MKTRNKKRRRSDDNCDGSKSDERTSTPTQSTAVWYKDGNLILEVEKTLFKVHRSVLEARSEVFRDMVALPQPPSAGVVDGCPIVRLSDASMDMEHALKALYGDSR
jgi:hypothetical protein